MNRQFSEKNKDQTVTKVQIRLQEKSSADNMDRIMAISILSEMNTYLINILTPNPNPNLTLTPNPLLQLIKLKVEFFAYNVTLVMFPLI